MFRDGITVFPDNLAVGTAGNIDYARKQGEIEAQELRRLGMDVNLGPVLDVLTEAYSPNIGIRSYGKDWQVVAAVHGERFRDIRPANTLVEARLVGDEYLVEIEAEAEVGSGEGGD